ncbi:MAG: hypothetical protein NTV93_20650 [Verrucomicrobia bacterium]|nr:hypothetical protein [Verrucomicrobiota bacterium]
MKSSPYTWPFGQPWLPQTEPAFAPGQVFIACENDALVIRAELNDAHVTQDVFPLNFPAFMHCDAFEIFLGPADEKAYYELHVTPSNSVLQLRFDGGGEAKPLEELTVAEPLFTSETAIMPEGWSVIARIPLDGLFPTTHPEWLLSFGRYDYTPGQTNPVISSTSPHTVCNFHRKEEWRRVRLVDGVHPTAAGHMLMARTWLKQIGTA